MEVEKVSLDITVRWKALAVARRPYGWSDAKSESVDPNWARRNVIYRWVKGSTGAVAHIGETNRPLTERVNNYISARPSSKAGATNKKLFAEQQRLSAVGDCLLLAFTAQVPGYNLVDDRDRKLAEHLLVGYYRPYLFGK